MFLERVISGGQTGADQAGWRAAKKHGIKTSGWMPRGFLTEDGPRPEFAKLYGAMEMDTSSYPDRTRMNVQSSHVTLWFGNPMSRGGTLTLSQCAMTQTPAIIIGNSKEALFRVEFFCKHSRQTKWKHFDCISPDLSVAPRINYRDFRFLNIAGNRESSAPGIGAWVEAYLIDVFRELAMF